MLKTDAIKLFGTRQEDLGDAVGISQSAISQWPPVLTEDFITKVKKAAKAQGKIRQFNKVMKNG